MTTRQRLLKIFNILLADFGKRNWWPAETQLEVIIGAILTQTTSWKNVEKAIENIKREKILDIEKLYKIDIGTLGEIIKPVGFFNIKSRRLKNFINMLHDDFNGSIDNLSIMPAQELRKLLLSIEGIGYETADSILLYALNKPVFVVDAYTKRFLKNHNLTNGEGNYNDVQRYFMKNLPLDTYIFNEFHALIVCLCQSYCKKGPICDECPLKNDKLA
jgi:endonuclease III related protein